MKKRNTILVGALILFFMPVFAAAVDVAPRITDLEIVERLARLEAGQQAIIREIDKRFEAIDKRFEVMDKRFDAMDRKIDLLAGIFTAMTVSVIGFAIWDRRTMIRPFEIKVKSIDGEILEIRGRQQGLIEAFQILGRRDEQVAEILKRFHLL